MVIENGKPYSVVEKEKNKFFIQPLGERCIVLRDEFKHKGNIIIPDVAKRATTTGQIVAMGDPHETLKIGDRIIYDPFSGGMLGFEDKFGISNDTYRYLNYTEIIGIVNDDEK